MQLLLGLFFFSVLLTTGSALSCEQCSAPGSHCTGSKQDCDSDNAVCMKLTTVFTDRDQKKQSILQTCIEENTCQALEDRKGKTPTTSLFHVPDGALIEDIICSKAPPSFASSKAPPSFASFFPAFLGLLLMKLLF